MTGKLLRLEGEPPKQDAIRILAADENHAIDLTRIYITGLSTGGRSAFTCLAKFPGFFAAAMPISMVASPEYFHQKNAAPIWIAINKDDRNYKERLEIFQRHYQKIGGEIRTTIYRRGGHNAWSQIMADQNFHSWLFSKRAGVMRE